MRCCRFEPDRGDQIVTSYPLLAQSGRRAVLRRQMFPVRIRGRGPGRAMACREASKTTRAGFDPSVACQTGEVSLMVMGTAWKAVGSGEQLGCGSIPHFSAMWLWSKCLGHKARGLKPPDVGSNPTSYTKPKREGELQCSKSTRRSKS